VSLSILHVSQPVDGGTARCVADLVADQVGRGWRVTVACPAGGPLLERVHEVGAAHVEWRARRAPGPRTPLETLRIAGIVSALTPDLVHLHSSKAGFAGRLALRGRVPTVFQPHAWSFFAVREPLRTATVTWERRAARLADVVVCVSEGERAAGEDAGIRAEWRIVPNGIDLEAFPPISSAERTHARQRLGLDAGPVAVCIGRLCRQKGQDVLVDAWSAVAQRVPSAELVLVGGGPDEAALRSRARVVGKQEDVRSWLAAADVVVQPSRWEGLSYVVLEAMASGRDVVATDVPGMREALGETGTIVPPEDPALLAAALSERLLDRDGQTASAARERVEALHDVNRTADAMARLYEDVLESRARSQ
jgi:glycosyltransferase involved in cell wall biosynthesis